MTHRPPAPPRVVTQGALTAAVWVAVAIWTGFLYFLNPPVTSFIAFTLAGLVAGHTLAALVNVRFWVRSD